MLLELRQVHKRYGETQVIKGLDLAVREGEFVGVIGPNGAGKSTAFGLMAGHLRCNSGSVWLKGHNVTRLDAAARCRLGMGRTFQTPQPFVGMSVYENTLVASSFGAGLHGADAQRAACRALERCGLDTLGDVPAGSLGLLHRKRLELARALATNPQVLLLDEVGGGLTDSEATQLVELVKDIHAQGVTVLWIEHLVHALASVAKRLVVLADGSVLADGVPAEVIGSKLVRETYLGTDMGVNKESGDATH